MRRIEFHGFDTNPARHVKIAGLVCALANNRITCVNCAYITYGISLENFVVIDQLQAVLCLKGEASEALASPSLEVLLV